MSHPKNTIKPSIKDRVLHSHTSFASWVVSIGLLIAMGLCVALILRAAPFSGFNDTHDGTNHLARFANYRIALREGQIPPRWAPNLLNHYGYPVFLLNYPLANILSVPLSVIGLTYEMTFSSIVLLFICMGATGVYLWLRQLCPVSSIQSRLFTVCAYISTPFAWNVVFVRGSLGELMAYALFPWVLYSFGRLCKPAKNHLPVMVATVAYAAFLLSHNVSAVVGSFVLMLWLLFAYTFHKAEVIKWIVAGVLGVALASWFWIPALLESSETVVFQANNNTEAIRHLISFPQVIAGSLGFGYSFAGVPDSMSYAISPLIWLGIVLVVLRMALPLVSINTKHPPIPRYITTATILFCLTVLLQLDFSRIIWQTVPQLSILQFPWRLALFSSIFALPILHWVYVQSTTGLKVVWVTVLVLTLISTLSALPDRVITRPDIYYETFAETTSTQHENMPKSFRYLDISDWKNEPSILSGDAVISNVVWSGSARSYDIDVRTNSVVIEPTARFIGWETSMIDRSEQSGGPVTYIDSETIAGRIAYELNVGTYTVTTRFTEKTVARVTGNIVTLLAVLVIVIYVVRLTKSRTRL